MTRTFLEFSRLDSTNEEMKRLLVDGSLEHFTIVDCKEQYSGKGQRGNVWQSLPDKNVHLSIYWEWSDLLVSNQFIVAQKVALALYEYLNSLLGVGVQIKWPNDLLVNKGKIGGILIENSLRGVNIASSIIGIGLNINQKHFEPTKRIATSLANELASELDLNKVKKFLLNALEYQLNRTDYNKIEQEYLQSLYGYDEFVLMQKEGVEFSGRIQKVYSNGLMDVLRSDGLVYSGIAFKEVEFM